MPRVTMCTFHLCAIGPSATAAHKSLHHDKDRIARLLSRWDGNLKTFCRTGESMEYHCLHPKCNFSSNTVTSSRMHHHGCKWYVKESQEARKAKGKSENTAPSLFSAVPGARGAAATSFDQHVPEGSPQSPSPTINTEKEKQPNPTAPQPKVPEASRRFWSPEDAIAAATKAACISKLDNLEQKVAAACDNVLKDFEQIVTNAVKAACDGILKDLEETIAATARAECNAMFLGIRQGMDSLSGEMRSLKENSFELTRLLADLVGSPAESQPEIPGVGDA